MVIRILFIERLSVIVNVRLLWDNGIVTKKIYSWIISNFIWTTNECVKRDFSCVTWQSLLPPPPSYC